MTFRFEDVAVGDALPVLEANICAAQLFQFSAVTNNPHRIHYDLDWARHEGYEERIIHGPLQGEMLAETVQRWLGNQGWLRKLKYSNRTYAVLGETLFGKARVTNVYEDETFGPSVDLEVWIEKADGTVTTPGTATAVLLREDA